MTSMTMFNNCIPYTALMGQFEASKLDPIMDVFPFVMILCVVGIPIVMVYLLYRYQTSSRNQLHRERLAAIEAGIDPHVGIGASASESYRNQAFWIAFWLVVCGCAASFFSVSQSIHSDTDTRIATIGWCAAGLASIVASITASSLIIKSKPS